MVRLASGLIVIALVAIVASCSKSSTSPSNNASISGTVTDAVSGQPINGATVSVGGQSSTTGADGKYSITGLATGSATLTASKQGERNFSQAVTLPTTTAVNIVMSPAPESAFSGTANGSWHNNTFGTSGPVTLTGTVDTVAQTYNGTITFGGNVFGVGTPPPQPLSGPYSTTGNTTFTGTSSFFGTVNATVTTTGQITGTMTNLPATSSVSSCTFNGTATATTVNMTYTVQLRAGGSANGTVTLSR